MSYASVPKVYQGVWRRTLLEQDGEVDSSSFVLWLQTEQYHADLRIPASRPTFNAINRLEDCSLDQLAWLATQQGFSGITQVDGNIATWLRDQDFQPSNEHRDIGEMKLETGDILIETGVEANYLERWEKVPNSHLNLSVKQAFGVNRHDNKVPARLFIANNLFAYVRSRDVQIPTAKSLVAAINHFQPSKTELLDWLDFEISFGEIMDVSHGYITNSTLPFREGKHIKLS